MIIYIIMLIFSILFMYVSTKAKKKWQKCCCYIMTFLPFFLVSALRYDLGTDYLRRYNFDYHRIENGIDVKNMEIGFKTIIRICLLFSQESTALFIVTSAITVGLIMYTIITKSKYPILSILIFFLGGFFFDSLNIVRQYLAVSLIVVAYPFLLDKKKYFLYAIFVILAGLMHSTAFIMLALMLLDKKMLADWKWVIPVTAIILILNENLMQIVKLCVQNTRFNVYLTGKFAKGDVSELYIIENVLVYIFMYYIYRKNKALDNVKKEDILFLNVQAVSLIMMALGACHMLFIRIALYFEVFQIISVPYYISVIPSKKIIEDLKQRIKGKVNLQKLQKNLKNYVIFTFVLGFAVVFTRTNIMKNTNQVLPYKTIINKNISIK